MSPELLVFIPLYNARPYIFEALESILCQSFSNFKVLVIDDGSTDAGGEIISQFADDRIIFLKQQNAGAAASMNRALKYALQNGYKYLARMDADDVSLSNRFEVQIALLEKHPEAVVCSANCYYIDSKIEMIIGSSTVPCSPRLIHWEIRHGLRGIIQGAAIFRPEALQAIGGYRTQFVTSEDMDVFLRLSEKYKFINSPEYLYKIRLREDSLSTKNVRYAILFQLYALDCANRRRANRSEISFREFENANNIRMHFMLWREEQLLAAWRCEMGKFNLKAIFLALFFDQRRIIARILRILDNKYHSAPGKT